MRGDSSKRNNGTPGSGFPWRRVGILLAAGLVFFGLFSVTAIYVFLSGLTVEEQETSAKAPVPDPGERIHILVLGVDEEQPTGDEGYVPARSDTLLLVTLDPVTSEANIVSIPRDTQVRIPGRPHPEKVAHAYAHGGAGLAMDTVSQFLNIPIHYHISLDFKGFANIIDAVGGVEMNVQQDMFYRDPAQDLIIDISAGKQHMDGDTALKYVRYRGLHGSDIDRIDRQQEFIDVLLRQALSVHGVLRLPEVARQIHQYMRTDMSPKQVVSLVTSFADISPDDVEFSMIPGEAGKEGGIWYWFADEEATREMIDSSVLGLVREENSSVTVEVLNGGGLPRAAGRVADRLRDYGYDVVEVGNAPDVGDERHESTRVIYRDDQLEGKLMVRALRSFLAEESGVKLYEDHNNAQVEEGEEHEQEPDAVITIYVGADFSIRSN